MNFAKSKDRAVLTNQRFGQFPRAGFASYHPDFEIITSKVQTQNHYVWQQTI
jgi:hypothetical protein